MVFGTWRSFFLRLLLLYGDDVIVRRRLIGMRFGETRVNSAETLLKIQSWEGKTGGRGSQQTSKKITKAAVFEIGYTIQRQWNTDSIDTVVLLECRSFRAYAILATVIVT
jgi:hypothetical protein